MRRLHSEGSTPAASAPGTPPAEGPVLFWKDVWTNELWAATIEGDVVTPYLLRTAAGTMAQWSVAPAVVSSVPWVYLMDGTALVRIRADGSAEEEIADPVLAIGTSLKAMTVDTSTGDVWAVIRVGSTGVQLHKVTTAGVETNEKTLPSSAYEYGFLQFDAANAQIIIARGNAANVIDIYDVSDFTAPVETIAAPGPGVSIGAPFVATATRFYYPPTSQTIRRLDRTDYSTDAPDPWNALSPDFIDAGIVEAEGSVYAVVFNDTTFEEELRRVTGDGGSGTVMTGWPIGQAWVSGFNPT